MRKLVLDHGYVDLVESWGSDERIIEAARMSTQKGFEGWGPKCRTCGDEFDAPERPCPNPAPGRELVETGRGGHVFDAPGDERLLAYLYNNNHATPFEMGGIVIEVQAPIFVFREWHRHRTQSYNEMSARYAPLPDVNYLPSAERALLYGSHLTKQASAVAGAAVLDSAKANEWRSRVEKLYADAQELYELGLSEGIPKELARIILPVGRYSRMRASANLRNWLGFLTLRLPENAQWEIRQYAEAVGELVAERFPRTWKLFKS